MYVNTTQGPHNSLIKNFFCFSYRPLKTPEINSVKGALYLTHKLAEFFPIGRETNYLELFYKNCKILLQDLSLIFLSVTVDVSRPIKRVKR